MTRAGFRDSRGRNSRYSVLAAQTPSTSSYNECDTVRLTFAQTLIPLLETERSPRSLDNSYSKFLFNDGVRIHRLPSQEIATSLDCVKQLVLRETPLRT